MVPEIFRSIRPHHIVVQDISPIKALENRRMEWSVVGDLPDFPWGVAKYAAASLIVLEPAWVWIEFQHR